MVRVFAGTNFYLIKSYVGQIRHEFIAKNDDMSVEEIDCEEVEFESFIAILNSTPLFASERLIIAKNIAQNKALSEKIEDIVKTAQDANELVIVEKDIDRRGSYYKFLKGNTDFTECGELDENQLVEWLRKEVKSHNGSLSAQDARYLVGRVGLSQQLLSNEIKKMVNYDKNISRDVIDKLTTEKPQSSVFNLLDAAFGGNSGQALKMYEEQKVQGSEPQSIFGMVIWQANIIATVAAGSNMSPAELSQITGIKPFTLTKANSIYKKIGKSGVNDLLDKLVRADRQMKTKSANPDEVVKNLLATIS